MLNNWKRKEYKYDSSDDNITDNDNDDDDDSEADNDDESDDNESEENILPAYSIFDAIVQRNIIALYSAWNVQFCLCSR